MGRSGPGTRSATRLFAAYAAISAVPVVALGVVLASAYHREADRRGLDEARSESALVAATTIEPVLEGVDLRTGLTDEQRTQLQRVGDSMVARHSVLRVRLRDLDGVAVWSQDGSGLGGVPEDEALDAAKGTVEAEITRLNSDANDAGEAVGQRAVEVYRPLYTGSRTEPVGVLEVYLPYDPIARDVSAGLGTLYRDLALGLGLLYVVLAGLSLATTRRLRQHARHNAYLADHDQLTGLPNRRLFEQRVEELATSHTGGSAAVAVLDLDRFKEVNDALGHRNGDELLVRIAGRLADAVRPGDTVARLGGDEFGVVLARVTDEGDALAALERLRAVVEQPLQVGGLPLTTEVSTGFALLPHDGDDAGTLVRRADIAMDVAKAGHSGVVRYDPAQDQYDSDRLAVVGELRRALGDDELVLHYQPKVDLLDGDVHEVEALIRWQHPRSGLLYPDAFLPLAEQTGLIDPLTDWVLAEALRQLAEWDDAGIARLSVAVNVSARNLSQAAFGDRVLAAVARSGLAAERLVLEITETALFADVDRAGSVLRRLADAGVTISLDDFGQGQTSLGYLSRLPLRELKIDRAFVTDMAHDEPHAAIVRSVVELAHNLGFVVVAEGVEDVDTLTALRETGCDAAQGYVISRPMPPAYVGPWLATWDPADLPAFSLAVS
jgi:diguanylate cyclase